MSALSGPFLAAALVLVAAAVAKLRSPLAAARAVGSPPLAVRTFALLELGLGVWGTVHPTVAGAVAIACAYCAFALIGVLLARRRVACGCFGSDEAAMSSLQVVLSAALALVALGAAVFGPPRGGAWMLAHGLDGIVLLAGSAACAYALVLAYTRLPQAWTAWSGP